MSRASCGACPAGTWGPGGNAAGCYPCLHRWGGTSSGASACVECVPNAITKLCPGEQRAG